MHTALMTVSVVIGVLIVASTVLSAVKTVVLPRAAVTRISRVTFLGVRKVIDLISRPGRDVSERDPILALYAPLGLVALPAVWVGLITGGYTLVFWGLGVTPLADAFTTSGSSILTLGFVRAQSSGLVAIEFTAAVIGLGVVSLLISYLPSIYSSFARRETLVGKLEVRAGESASPIEMLIRYHRIGRIEVLTDELFSEWETWFAEIEESHTSQPSLVFFRSPQPNRSWITAAGCVLDTAALYASTVQAADGPESPLLIRTGFMALRRIADFFGIEHPSDPAPSDPISIMRDEFDDACAALEGAGLELRPDREQAWTDFAGWRVNYDAVLIALCALVVAPPAMWSSDRGPLRAPKVHFRSLRRVR